jgi:HEAT repeats
VTKRRTILLYTLLLLTAASLGYYYGLYSHEPTYEGRTCRGWLIFNYTGGDKNDEAPQAIRELGTNAIPTLLTMLRAETNSAFLLQCRALCDKIDFFKGPLLAWEENLLAARGFGCLGSEATNAIPDLIAMYRQTNSPRLQAEALSVLSGITPTQQSTALMKEALTSSNVDLRLTAYLHFAERNQDNATPLLITALSDPSRQVQSMAAYQLQRFGTNAITAVPALLPLVATITNKNGYFDNFAAKALRTIDPETAAKVLPPKFTPPIPPPFQPSDLKMIRGIRIDSTPPTSTLIPTNK